MCSPRYIWLRALVALVILSLLFPLSVGSQTPGTPKETLTNSIGMEFVLIPAGTFEMGSATGEPDERPTRKVTISKPFFLGKYEVTQAQWQAIMGKNPSFFGGNPNLPVESVWWTDVQLFIRLLNAKEGHQQYRLPTEAEWEYAARAGTTTTFPFGNDAVLLSEHAWYKDNAGGTTHPVGRLKPNAWGLHDMLGNVWEWVQDWYQRYEAGAVTDPTGPDSGTHRMRRGCAWNNAADICRAANRYSVAGYRDDFLGFRLLRTAP